MSRTPLSSMSWKTRSLLLVAMNLVPMQSALATIEIPLGPQCTHVADVAFTPGFDRAFVTCQDTNNVAVIDVDTRTVTDYISLTSGDVPWEIVVSADGQFAYVTNSGFHETTGIHASVPGTVSVIDLNLQQQVDDITVGVGPNGIARLGDRLFVANTRGNSVSVIDTTTSTVIETIPVGQAPFRIRVSPDGNWVVVVNFYDASATVLDSDDYSELRTVTTGVPALTDPFPEFGGGDTVDVFFTGNLSAWAVNFRSRELVRVDLENGSLGQHVSLPQNLPVTMEGITEGLAVVLSEDGSPIVGFNTASGSIEFLKSGGPRDLHSDKNTRSSELWLPDSEQNVVVVIPFQELAGGSTLPGLTASGMIVLAIVGTILLFAVAHRTYRGATE